jgi:dATP pyrophosphohydrolase
VAGSSGFSAKVAFDPSAAAALHRVMASMASCAPASAAVPMDGPGLEALQDSESVLVVIYRADGQVLLLRAPRRRPRGSPSGNRSPAARTSRGTGRPPCARCRGNRHRCPGPAACCGLGLENVYTIYPHWLHRYAPGVGTTGAVFGLRVPWAPACT